MMHKMPGDRQMEGTPYTCPGTMGKLLRFEPLHNAGNQFVLDALL